MHLIKTLRNSRFDSLVMIGKKPGDSLNFFCIVCMCVVMDTKLCFAFWRGAMLFFPVLALQTVAADKQRSDKADKGQTTKDGPCECLALGSDAHGNGKQSTRHNRADTTSQRRERLREAVEGAKAGV